MPLTERSYSLNTYGLPKVWYKSHMMEYRVGDITDINKQMRSWLFADLLEKPVDLIRYRSSDCGGLSLHHVKSKCTAILIKSLMETSCNAKFRNSLYHQALIQWNVHDNREIPEPVQTPFYSEEVYNIIKAADNKDLPIATMATKEWYNFILSSVIYEPDADNLIPCRVELKG